MRITRPLLIVAGKVNQINGFMTQCGHTRQKAMGSRLPELSAYCLSAFWPDGRSKLLQAFLFIAANDEELVQLGDFEDFPDLRIDVTQDEPAARGLDLFVQRNE